MDLVLCKFAKDQSEQGSDIDKVQLSDSSSKRENDGAVLSEWTLPIVTVIAATINHLLELERLCHFN